MIRALLPMPFVLVVACGTDAQADGEADGQAEGAYERVINVEVQELRTSSFTETARISGTVQAERDVLVAAEEGGVIRDLPVAQGSSVQAGDVLARIDDGTLQAQVREARARADLARETWERRRRLYEDDSVGSELAYLEARSQAEQSGAALDALQERLDRTVVRAPIAGIVEERLVEEGTMVSPGTPVARVVQVDPVKVTGGVPERFAAEIRTGSSARVTFDVLPDQEFEGPLTFVGATVNPANRTFPVELRVPNRNNVIKPEMVANLEIIRNVRNEVVVIPQEAVVRVEEGFVAFVAVERDGSEFAEVRRLSLSGSQANRVVVENGLAAGDRLIVAGQSQVANGDRIQVVGTREQPDD
ncbi:MAG: efflux RND transporter periplasmic adaptor subunit [Gemmatimonadota bacterium]